MRAIPPSERPFATGRGGSGSDSAALLASAQLSDSECAETKGKSEPFRAVRAPLRDLLDEEFQKNYRFDRINDLQQYFKGLWRTLVDRDPEDEYGEFVAGREPRDPHHPD